MVSISSSNVIQQAEVIPYVTADEAYSLMKVQLERFITLVDALIPSDWSRPTACTLWNVQDIVAHQVGGYASGTGYREMIRQYISIPKKGQLPEDAVNELQVRERSNRPPTELIAELRAIGPTAIEKWAYEFRLVKLLSIPHPVPGVLSLRHLMWVIHSRDTWMHRLDICRATGRAFEQTVEQEGRIAALVMLDVAKTLQRKLGNLAVVFELSGISGGAWKIGTADPTAAIQMDALDFYIYISGRYSYEEARERVSISGDITLADKTMKNLLVLF